MSEVPDLQEDELERAFPGCVLTHVLTVVTHDGLALALRVLTSVQETGAQLRAMHLTYVGQEAHHQLRITGIRPSAARILKEQIAELPTVSRVAIEHQMLRP